VRRSSDELKIVAETSEALEAARHLSSSPAPGLRVYRGALARQVVECRPGGRHLVAAIHEIVRHDAGRPSLARKRASVPARWPPMRSPAPKGLVDSLVEKFRPKAG
jgi:hypothetical protein